MVKVAHQPLHSSIRVNWEFYSNCDDFTLIGLDCMLRPDMCGPNASCKETNKKVVNQWKYHQCVCNPGFVGNGITCIDATDLANGTVVIT